MYPRSRVKVPPAAGITGDKHVHNELLSLGSGVVARRFSPLPPSLFAEWIRSLYLLVNSRSGPPPARQLEDRATSESTTGDKSLAGCAITIDTSLALLV